MASITIDKILMKKLTYQNTLLFAFIFCVFGIGSSNCLVVNNESDSLDTKPLIEDSFCSVGKSICHSSAKCNDYEKGFCCSCPENSNGNGINCVQKDVIIGVLGSVDGEVNGISIEGSHFTSYARLASNFFTCAVNKIPKAGYDLQGLAVLGEGAAWLFALPDNGVPNGFDLTGGIFNRTVKYEFIETGHKLLINQTFKGFDLHGHLVVDTNVSGSWPKVPIKYELIIEAFKEKFTRVMPGVLTATSSRSFKKKIRKSEEIIKFKVETIIQFKECEHAPKEHNLDTLFFEVAENDVDRTEMIVGTIQFSIFSKLGKSKSGI